MRLLTPTGALNAWVTIGLLVICVGAVTGAGIAYTAQRSKDICGMIVILDDRNQKLPPATDPDTANFRRELHAYRERIGC